MVLHKNEYFFVNYAKKLWTQVCSITVSASGAKRSSRPNTKVERSSSTSKRKISSFAVLNAAARTSSKKESQNVCFERLLSELKPGQWGWVVGYWTISTPELATEFNQEIGSGIYTIEFEDKPSGVEIPEMFIVGKSDAESN